METGRRTRLTVAFNGVDISTELGSGLKSMVYTDEADGATDDLKLVVDDPDNVWIGAWLRSETENRDTANSEIEGSAADTTSGSGTGYTVTAKIGLNVRTGPGTSYTTAGALAYGTTVTVASIENGWATIDYNGGTYYVAAQYLTESSGGESQSDDTAQDGSGTSAAKYTKVDATLTLVAEDGSEKALQCGSFEIDDVHVSGPPQVVDISATSLSYQSAIRKTKKTRSWVQTTLSGILGTCAGSGGYSPMYLSDYDPSYSYILQDDVTDIEFLSRLATNAGLSLKVTNGSIILFDEADYEAQPVVRTIKRGDGSYTSYDFDSTLSTTAYSKCHVSYSTEDGTTYEATFTPATAFSEGEVLEVTEEVGSNAEALTLAKKRLRAANKGEMTGSLTMVGDPALQAGLNVAVSGWGDVHHGADHQQGAGGLLKRPGKQIAFRADGLTWSDGGLSLI
jgi:hypothetical protein